MSQFGQIQNHVTTHCIYRDTQYNMYDLTQGKHSVRSMDLRMLCVFTCRYVAGALQSEQGHILIQLKDFLGFMSALF